MDSVLSQTKLYFPTFKRPVSWLAGASLHLYLWVPTIYNVAHEAFIEGVVSNKTSTFSILTQCPFTMPSTSSNLLTFP